MTQQQLAQAAGIPQPSIARIEREAVIPRTATLLSLLEATGHGLSVEPIGAPVDREPIRRRLAMAVHRRTLQALGGERGDPLTGPIGIIKGLRRFGVPFVLIGEMAEVAHGSPMEIGPLVEVCHADTEVARHRLGRALEDLGPAVDSNRLRPVTQTAAGDNYDMLARNAISMHVAAGILVRVAAVEDLVRVRRSRCTPEDDEVARVLLAILTGGA